MKCDSVPEGEGEVRDVGVALPDQEGSVPFLRSLHSSRGSVSRPSAGPPSCDHETTALCSAGPGVQTEEEHGFTVDL